MFMRDKSCTFCSLYEKRIIQDETEFFWTNFDAFPITPGHTEIVPKRHVASSLDLTAEEWADLHKAIKQGTQLIYNTNWVEFYEGLVNNPLNDVSKEYCQKALEELKEFGPIKDWNRGENDGPIAGQTIPHFHYHLIPRFKGDVKDPIGGVRHIIPGKGNYKN